MSTACTGILAGCATDPIDDAPDEELATTEQGITIGGSLPGITAADFAAAKTLFNTVEELDDGLGPIFNEKACGACHTQGASGGAGVQIERRFGKFNADGTFNSLASEGGSLRQLFTVGTFTNSAGKSCTVPLEQEPADATVRNVGRLTTPLFGLGLVDAMPDSFFDNLVANEPASFRGTVNRVKTLLPNPADPSQSINGTRVGRFGWKAGVPNLVQFAADAYINEMGISTQHCIRGTSVLAFASESKPNGRAVAAGCDDRGPGGPGLPAGTDEGPGSCAGGLTSLQEDVEAFADFMTFLAPPAVDTNVPASTLQAALNAARKAQCTACHSDATFRTPASPANGVPGNFAFQPFSDFALHDMGTLGDRIGNDGDSQTRTRMMRTAPLWGLRFRTKYLHDGRTGDLNTAIHQHAGQATASVRAFDALTTTEKNALFAGLKAL